MSNRRNLRRRKPLLEELESRRVLAGSLNLIKDVNPGAAGSDIFPLAEVNNFIFFSAETDANGQELWRTDGTNASLVHDIRTGTSSSTPENLTNVNGSLFFSARGDNGLGEELWRLNGTSGPAVMVKDVYPANSDSYPANFVNVNGVLFFTADDGSSGIELWKSNGTEGDTVRVADINPGSADADPRSLVNVNGTLYFSANRSSDGRELWKSDGTEAGTVRVKDIYAGATSSNPYELTNVGGTLFFSARDAAAGAELWKSGGSEATTVRVKDIFAGLSNTYPDRLTNVNGVLFFAAGELWRSDGTSAGTYQVKNIDNGGADVKDLVNVNGTLYFTSFFSDHGRELWKSNGTEAGTVEVKDINQEDSSYIRSLVNADGTLYFSADDGTGSKLWRSNGTAATTTKVYSASGATSPSNLTVSKGRLFLTATTAAKGEELYRVNRPPKVVVPTAATYTPGQAAVLIAPAGTLTDPDSSNLASGKLTVKLALNQQSLDQLSISPGGGITLSGSNVLHNGTQIGTLAAISGNGPLVVTFNNNATPVKAQALLRRIAFRTTASPPTANVRSVTFQVTDGDGATSELVTQGVNVAAPNTAPVLNISANPAFSPIPEDTTDPAGKKVSDFLFNRVTDPDSGALKGIAVIGAPGANGRWQFTLGSGTDWKDMGAVSGTSARLIPQSGKVRFIPNANFNGTLNLTYRAWDQTQGLRGETFDLTNNLGGSKAFSTAQETAKVTVSAVNDAPQLLEIDGPVNYVHDTAAVVLVPNAGVSDADGGNFANGELRVEMSTPAAQNIFAIGGNFIVDGSNNVKIGTTIIGQRTSNGVGTNDLVITFNTDATIPLVQQLLRAITFRTNGGSAGSRTVFFTLADGDGEDVIRTLSLNVT